MQLLIQTIQEYLNDHHHNWKVHYKRPGGVIKIVHLSQSHKQAKSSIWISHRSIEYYNNSMQYIRVPYTMEDLLPQITRVIESGRVHDDDLTTANNPRVSE